MKFFRTYLICAACVLLPWCLIGLQEVKNLQMQAEQQPAFGGMRAQSGSRPPQHAEHASDVKAGQSLPEAVQLEAPRPSAPQSKPFSIPAVAPASGGDFRSSDSKSDDAQQKSAAHSTSTDSGCFPMSSKSVMEMLDGSPTPTMQNCALVGSSPVLKGKGLGDTIDQFQIVIRVNRLPLQSQKSDFGSKTTAYFKNTIGDYIDGGTKVRVRYQQGDKGPLGICNIVTGEGCPFDRVIYEGWKDPKLWRRGKSNIPVGFQAAALQHFQHQVEALGLYNNFPPEEKPLYKVRPSGGMKAFFTAALLCDRLDLFGFGGAGTIDNHVLIGHEFEKEHAFLDLVASGNLKETDLPSSKNFSEAVAHFRARLVLQSRNRCITVHRD